MNQTSSEQAQDVVVKEVEVSFSIVNDPEEFIYFFFVILSICIPIALCTSSSVTQSTNSLMSSSRLFSNVSTASLRMTFFVISRVLAEGDNIPSLWLTLTERASSVYSPT